MSHPRKVGLQIVKDNHRYHKLQRHWSQASVQHWRSSPPRVVLVIWWLQLLCGCYCGWCYWWCCLYWWVEDEPPLKWFKTEGQITRIFIHDMHHCNVFWRPSSWLVESDVKSVNTSLATNRLLGPWCNVKRCISWIEA